MLDGGRPPRSHSAPRSPTPPPRRPWDRHVDGPIGDRHLVGGVGVDNGGVAGLLARPVRRTEQDRLGEELHRLRTCRLGRDARRTGPRDVGSFLDSPYLYHDVAVWPGRIPANPSVVTEPRDYAHLDASYAGEPGYYADNYGYPTDAAARCGRYTGVPLFVFTPTIEMNLPFRRDEYYSTKNVHWAFSNEVYSYSEERLRVPLVLDSEVKAFRPGENDEALDWQRGVFGPSLADSRLGNPGEPAAVGRARRRQPQHLRADVLLTAYLSRLGDSDSTSELTKLYRNGQEVRSTDTVGLQPSRCRQARRPTGWRRWSSPAPCSQSCRPRSLRSGRSGQRALPTVRTPRCRC